MQQSFNPLARGFFNLLVVVTFMSSPRVVDIKKKPRVVGEKDKDDDYSLIVGNDASQELRKRHLQDITPAQPRPGDKFEISEDVRKKIEEDRKKRRGVVGDVKDVLGLK